MNALAKVLIVLVLLLSAGFAVSQMVLFGKREHYAALHSDAVTQLNTETKAHAETKKRAQDLARERDQIKNDLDTENRRLASDVADAQARIRDMTAEVAALTTMATTQAGAIAAAEGRLDQKEAAITERNDIITERTTEIQQKADTIDGLNTDVAERDTQIGELDHDLTESKKAYQVLALDSERMGSIIEELRLRGVHIPPAPLPVVNGRIIIVDAGLGIATVNKGKVDGVKPNTQFTLYDGDGYVGKLIVHDVQTRVSAGNITLQADGKEVKQGDRATTEIP